MKKRFPYWKKCIRLRNFYHTEKLLPGPFLPWKLLITSTNLSPTKKLLFHRENFIKLRNFRPTEKHCCTKKLFPAENILYHWEIHISLRKSSFTKKLLSHWETFIKIMKLLSLWETFITLRNFYCIKNFYPTEKLFLYGEIFLSLRIFSPIKKIFPHWENLFEWETFLPLKNVFPAEKTLCHWKTFTFLENFWELLSHQEIFVTLKNSCHTKILFIDQENFLAKRKFFLPKKIFS